MNEFLAIFPPIVTARNKYACLIVMRAGVQVISFCHVLLISNFTSSVVLIAAFHNQGVHCTSIFVLL